MKKYFLLSIATIVIVFSACNQSGKKKQNNRRQIHEKTLGTENKTKTSPNIKKFPELTPEEYFHAVVFDTMTLSQVAKKNEISLPFLKTKLGIPKSVTYDYTINQLKRNFHFTTEHLKDIIENSKNESKVVNKKLKMKRK
jgi:hypothetical protein